MPKKSRRRQTSAPVEASARPPPPPVAAAASASSAPPAAHHQTSYDELYPDLCSHGYLDQSFCSVAEVDAYHEASNEFIKIGMETQRGREMADAIQVFLTCHSHLDPERIIKTLVNRGTSKLLEAKEGDPDQRAKEQDYAFHLCRFYGFLINDLSKLILLYKEEFTDQARLYLNDELDKLMDCDRETVKFYDRRITCGCLKPLLASASSKESVVCCCKRDECNVRASEGGRTLFLCAGCKSTKYCSRECQRKHWAEHKERCREIRKLREEQSKGDAA